MMKEMYLQYISQGETPKEHLDNIEQVCKAGGKWIQLRIKDQDMATYLDTAIKCRNICDRYNAIMIVNDNIGVAKAALADGVHLGLQDMNTREARKILGDNFIIGATANTLQDCKKHSQDEVDYIGLGPYRHTTTKKKLSPVLGIKGYEEILSEFRIQNTTMPVVAIGGITEQDIIALMQTGISGVAVSGLLTNKDNIKQKIKNIKEQIEKRCSSK